MLLSTCCTFWKKILLKLKYVSSNFISRRLLLRKSIGWKRYRMDNNDRSSYFYFNVVNWALMYAHCSIWYSIFEILSRSIWYLVFAIRVQKSINATELLFRLLFQILRSNWNTRNWLKYFESHSNTLKAREDWWRE